MKLFFLTLQVLCGTIQAMLDRKNTVKMKTFLKTLSIFIFAASFSKESYGNRNPNLNYGDFLPPKELRKEDKELIQELTDSGTAIARETQHQYNVSGGAPSANFNKLTPAQQIGVKEAISLLKEQRHSTTKR